MASKRNAKKDINYLTYEVVADCYIYLHLYPEKSEKEVLKLADETLDLRDKLIHKVNHPEGENRKEIKSHFRGIYDELIQSADNTLKKLSELTQK